MAELLTAGSVLYKIPRASAVPDAASLITEVGVNLAAPAANASKTPLETVGARAPVAMGVQPARATAQAASEVASPRAKTDPIPVPMAGADRVRSELVKVYLRRVGPHQHGDQFLQ